MATRKRQSPIRKRQLRRVRQFIRRAESRGYRFDTEFKESISTLSTQKLKSLKSEKLYSQATALSAHGDIVVGTQRRAEERRESAQRAVATRRHRMWLQTPEGMEWQRQMEIEAEEIRQKAYEEEMLRLQEKAREYAEGEIILAQLESMIDMYDTIGAEYLKRLLASDIRTFGRENVARALASVGEEAIRHAEVIVHYPQDSLKTQTSSSITGLANLIRGYIPTEEESKQDGEVEDLMGYES